MRTNETRLRRVTLRPYLSGASFTLTTWDGGRPIHSGASQWKTEYRLTMRENGKTVVLFDGADYGCSPCEAIDSDACVYGILSFLTLRPGDTYPEYFDRYTPAQLAYCAQHAEALSNYAADRFDPESKD